MKVKPYKSGGYQWLRSCGWWWKEQYYYPLKKFNQTYFEHFKAKPTEWEIFAPAIVKDGLYANTDWDFPINEPQKLRSWIYPEYMAAHSDLDDLEEETDGQYMINITLKT